MTLDDIEADSILEMTSGLQRLFRLANCDPACHCCEKPIETGSMFKLACVELLTNKTEYFIEDAKRHDYETGEMVTHNDEMLCAKCSAKDLRTKWESAKRQELKDINEPCRGYSRPSTSTVAE